MIFFVVLVFFIRFPGLCERFVMSKPIFLNIYIGFVHI